MTSVDDCLVLHSGFTVRCTAGCAKLDTGKTKSWLAGCLSGKRLIFNFVLRNYDILLETVLESFFFFFLLQTSVSMQMAVFGLQRRVDWCEFASVSEVCTAAIVRVVMTAMMMVAVSKRR
jgi:hypothetical protein